MENNLTHNKVCNILYFVAIISVFDNTYNQSPDYILEKWNRYIGMDVSKSSVDISIRTMDKIEKYKARWSNSELYDRQFHIILNYLFNMTTINHLSTMVDEFKKYVGSGDINNSDYDGGIHPIMVNHIKDSILDNPINADYIMMLRRNESINNIIS